MLRIVPASREIRPEIEELFGERGGCAGCWCMVWRLPRKQWESGKGSGNKRAFQTLIDSGTPPGLVAFDGAEAVGWCSVAPREQFVYLARSRSLKPLDANPVWSVTCLFVRKDQRRQGIAVALLNAAANFVRSNGGRIVEGYPVQPSSAGMPDVFAWTGTVRAFLAAGFREAARPSASRAIMRLDVE